MKSTFTLSCLLAGTLFIGCGSSSDSADKTEGKTGAFEGYAQSIDGAPLFLRTFVVNDDTIVMQRLDEDDNVTVLAGSISGDAITFGDVTCTVSGDAMECDGYTLEKMALTDFNVSMAEGTYLGVDDNHTLWTMTIDTEGGIMIASDETPGCSVEGTLSAALSGRLPAVVLEPTRCGDDDREYGVALAQSLATDADTVNLLLCADASSTYWIKQ